jgi:P pilus assembly chaperone PapD
MLAANATSFSFGPVPVGSSAVQTLTLTNSGNAAVMIAQATITGTGFNIAGSASSISVAPGQSHAFQIQFVPQAPGSATGNFSVNSNAADSQLSVALVGTALTTPVITTQPAGQNVVAGQTASFTVAATSSGTLTYQWNKNGTAISGATSPLYTTPATTAADNGAQFTVTVTNSVATITSNVATLTVGPATFILNASRTSLPFGAVNTGSSSVLGATFTNAGNSIVTISNVSVSGAGFTAGGISSGQMLSPGQTATLNVTFAPAAAGSMAGSATVTSDAASSPFKISLSGTGAQPATHSVTLNWIASTATVSGYNVYRSTISGGPYAMVNSSLVNSTTYLDSTVQSGQTYFYSATSVDSGGNESIFSTEATAIIP